MYFWISSVIQRNISTSLHYTGCFFVVFKSLYSQHKAGFRPWLFCGLGLTDILQSQVDFVIIPFTSSCTIAFQTQRPPEMCLDQQIPVTSRCVDPSSLLSSITCTLPLCLLLSLFLASCRAPSGPDSASCSNACTG